MDNLMHDCISTNTWKKHRHCRQMFDVHSTISKKKILGDAEVMSTYIAFDLDAGPGVYPPGTIPGVDRWENCSSLDLIQICRYKNIPSDIVLCENHHRTFVQCREVVNQEDWGSCSVTLLPKCNEEVTKTVGIPPRPYVGLAYADPHGAGREEWKSLVSIAETHPYVDLMIHIQGGTMKRMRRTGYKGPAQGYLSISDYIQMLKERGKKKFLMKFLENSKKQTGFLFATHEEDVSVYEQFGFHDIDNRYGRSILTYMDCTSEELDPHSTHVECGKKKD